MKYLHACLMCLFALFPTLAWADAEPTAAYRGIASIYYALIWGVLSYGLYDAFGRTAFYVGAPIAALIIYFLLPTS